jgi:hypothetical protein
MSSGSVAGRNNRISSRACGRVAVHSSENGPPMPRPTDRVLSTRALNRALLARQLLLERSALPLTEALEAVGGLQTQYAPSGYLALWSRLVDFRREALTEALVDRTAVQATLMRSTIHTVSAHDYWLFAEGTRNARREWWLRVQQKELGDIDVDRMAARLRDLLSEGPRRANETLNHFEHEGLPRLAWLTACQLGDLVRVPPSGTWERRRADLYGLADAWLGPSTVTEAEGQEHLVRRYLGGFGPASLGDIGSWAALPATTVRSVVERLDLVRLRDEAGKELVDLPGAPLPDPDTPAPVRFLPTWDATLLVHARRTQILPERYRPLVFNTKTPHSVPTFLVDGAVAGKWRYEKDRIDIEPFGPIPKTAQRRLEEEAERLATFHCSTT